MASWSGDAGVGNFDPDVPAMGPSKRPGPGLKRGQRFKPTREWYLERADQYRNEAQGYLESAKRFQRMAAAAEATALAYERRADRHVTVSGGSRG